MNETEWERLLDKLDKPRLAIFNSTKENAEKEHDGRKSNTIRLIDLKDDRFNDFITHVGIRNKETGVIKIFELTDKTDFQGFRIFSWKPN